MSDAAVLQFFEARARLLDHMARTIPENAEQHRYAADLIRALVTLWQQRPEAQH